VRGHLAHDRTESRDRARAEVVAVAEAAGKHDHVHAFEIGGLVPEIHCRQTQYVDDGVVAVVVAVGTREGDDAELHARSTVAISKSSVTGLASSLSHIARTWSFAAFSSG